MSTAAALSVRISANTSDFDKGLKSLEKSFGSWGTKLTSIGDKLTTGITLPLAATAIAATKFASDFEKSTTKLVTLSGVSKKQMLEMKQAVLDLAPAVGIGPNALSEALLVVTSTGFQGAAALSILELAAKSSAIGMGDTKDVARALTAAVSAYGVENLSAATAADVLHATVVAGGAEAAELAGEMGRVVGVAASLGVSFQEVGAFIATYTRLGLSAAEATTGLSGVLNTVLNPSKEARDALAGMGISAQGLRDAIANKGLGATLTELIARLHGNADATGALFGNVRALAGVMGTAGTQAAAYKSNLDAIQGSTGGLNRAFDETKKTFAFMWDQFKASAEKAAITLGVQLLPAAIRILEALKPLADLIVRMVVLFSQLPQPVQMTVIGFLALLAALGPILSMAGRVSTSLGALASAGRLASSGLTATFGAAALSTAGTVAGVLGLAAGFGLLAVKIHESIKEMGLWATLRNGFVNAAAGGAFGVIAQQVLGGGSGGPGAPRRGVKGKDVFLPNETTGGPSADILKAVGMSKAEWDKLFAAGGLGAAGGGEKARVNPFSGSDIFKDAAQAIKDVTAVGGVTKLTGDETKRLNGILGDAIEKYQALGQIAPAAMLRVWAATMPTPAVTDGISDILKDLTSIAVVAPNVPLPNLPIAAGIGGQSVGGPSVQIGAFKAPSLMNQIMGAFGSVKDFGANLSNTILSAFTGGGDVGKSIGALLGGGALSGVAKKAMGALGSKGLGGLLGGALGSVLPGLGNLLGSLGGNAISGLFGKLFGGEKKKTNQARDAYIEQAGGITELKKAAEEAGFSLEKMLSTKKVKDFQTEVGKLNTAMDAHKNMLAGIDQVLSGVNARSSVFGETLKTASEKHASALADRMKTLGIDPTSDQGKALTTQSQAQFSTGHQAEFDRIGAMAVSSFGMQMQTGGSAIAALTAMAPTLAVLTEAQKQFNFAASETTQKLLDISTAVEADRPAFQALEADGQIVRGMLQGNLMDLSLFKAVSSDITSQIGNIVANGVPMSQALALAQPQLQGLWEAQQKFGFETDEATKALLEQATTQGIVGPQMKSVNDRILDVLLAIGEVLGADIPNALAGLPGAAQSAANGMNAAFGSVQVPGGGYQAPQGPTLEGAEVPEMAAGGIVSARPGGTLVRVGEGGRDEAIVPLGGGGRVGSTHITINHPVVDSDARVEQLATAVARRIYQGGAVRTQWSRALQGLT